MKNKIFLSLVVIMCLSFTTYGLSADKMSYGNLTVSKVLSIYDGDTFRCDIKGIHPLLGHYISIRIGSIDTAEMRDKRPKVLALARAAKRFAVAELRGAHNIELRNVRRGKYFRIVADVYVDGENLGDLLIKKGLAHRYAGGKKTPW